MEKNCIFCGISPQNKNKEHVLPDWLLKFTGDPKRTTRLGLNWSTGKEMSFSYNSLVFPSCKSCNDRYSLLEIKAKSIVEKIHNYEFINQEDINLLLD